MQDPRFFAVVVIYNCSPKNSVSCRCLARIGIPCLILDNSTCALPNETDAAEMGFRYCSMGGNAGLSKAYNRAVALLQGQCDFLCLFDDDTKVPADYCDCLRNAIAKKPVELYFPFVRDQVGLLSPCKIRGCKVSRSEDPAACPPTELTAINSGMAIAMRVFADYRYDEGYFLDYVDHAFVRDQKKAGARIACFDAVLIQDYSGNANGDISAMRKRYAIFHDDFLRFCEGTAADRWYARLSLLRRRWKIRLLSLRGRRGGKRKRSEH